MAITQNTFTGNGSNLGPFSFTFKWLESTDVKVTVGGVLKTAGTHYNLQALNYTTKDGGQVLFTAGNAPDNGAAIRVYRDTDDSALSATFYSGSAIRAQDLNDDFTQNLYSTQEVKARYLDRQSGEMDAAYVPSTSTDVVTKGYMETNYGIIDEVGFTRWRQVATAGQTTFSGGGSYGNVLSFVPNREQVYLNGALQQVNVDYTASTTGTSITFSPGLTVGDVVDVVCINNLVQNSTTNSDDLTFVQAGTGAVTRSVGSKLRDVVSANDFGAAEDAARLNQALATGKLVNGPKANYVLETNVTPGTGALFLEPGSTIDKPERLLPRGKASDLGNGVNLWRLQDRLFIGGANKVADTKSPVLNGFGIAGDPAGINSDYLERGAALISSSAYGGLGGSFAARQSLQYSAEGYTTWASGQSVTIGAKRGYYEKLYTATTSGTTGGTPPSHTSGTASDGGVTWQFDNYTYMVPIGLASIADADVSDGHSCWALYLEGLRRSGGGTILTSEIAVKNKGSNVTANPYSILPGGASVGIWLAGGGDASLGAPANPSTTAIAIAKNGHTWNSGIVFGFDAITTNGSAIALATNHKITWHSNDGGERCYITSDRTDSSNGGGLKFTDNSIWLNPSGPLALNVTGSASDTSYFQMNSGTTSVSISAQSSASNVGITLAAKGTGRIRLNSTLEFAYAGFTSASTPANFTADRYMVVTDASGTSFYIPARLATW